MMVKALAFPTTLIGALFAEWWLLVQSGLFGRLMDATVWTAVAGVQDAYVSLGPLAYLIGIGVVSASLVAVAAVIVLCIWIAVLMAKAISP